MKPAPLIAIWAGVLGIGAPAFAQYESTPPPPPVPYRPGDVPRAYPYAPAPYPGADPTRPIAPPVPSTAGQVTALADLLAGQAEAFLRAFRFQIGIVPQGYRFMADATALRDSALRLRDVAASGYPPPVLSAEFRNVAWRWRRLESRMAYVNRGRIGPNIATALQMGGTVEQIRQLLP